MKVRDISVDDNQKPTLNNGIETVLTYNAYKILGSTRYVLLFQSDDKGNQIPGNPNLEAQHKELIARNGVEAVGNAGPSESEIALQDEITRLRIQLEQARTAQANVAPVVEAAKVNPVENPDEQKQTRTRKPQTQLT